MQLSVCDADSDTDTDADPVPNPDTDGVQFSAGGPGKGLTSRIFRNVLSNPEVLTANCINISYKDAGLFGVQATCESQVSGTWLRGFGGWARVG